MESQRSYKEIFCNSKMNDKLKENLRSKSDYVLNKDF